MEAKYAIESIRDCKLKVSVPSELNDPFEMLPRPIEHENPTFGEILLSDEERRKRFFTETNISRRFDNYESFKSKILSGEIIKIVDDKFKSMEFFDKVVDSKKIDKFIRIISFSSESVTKKNEILLWSHYGDEHKGLKLGFDSNDLEKIDLVELHEIKYWKKRYPIDYARNNEKSFHDGLFEALKVKAKCWKYEKEFRLLV